MQTSKDAPFDELHKALDEIRETIHKHNSIIHALADNFNGPEVEATKQEVPYAGSLFGQISAIRAALNEQAQAIRRMAPSI